MKRTLLGIAVAATLASGALAQSLPSRSGPLPDPRSDRMEYEIELGVEVSDNRARREPKDDAGVNLVPRGLFWLFHHGARLEARAIGLLEHYQRLGSDFGSDANLQLAAIADWALLPQRLYWTFQDFADVEPVDILAADDPDNRQQTNTFVTGPTLLISPSGLWGGELDARYVRSDAEHTDSYNSDRYIAGGRLLFRPRPHRTFSLGIEASEVDQRDETPEAGDYERVDASLQFRNTMRRLGIEVVAGRTEIDFDNGQQLDGPLFKAWLSWAFSEDHRLLVRLAREFSDAARDLIGILEPFETLREEHAQPEPRAELYRSRRAELEWYSTGRRSGWSLSPYYRDYDYPFEIEPLSHEARGAVLRGDYRLGAADRLRGEIGYERREFTTTVRDDREAHVSLTWERELNSRWSIRTGVHHFDRDSSDPLGANYRENMVTVALVLKGGR